MMAVRQNRKISKSSFTEARLVFPQSSLCNDYICRHFMQRDSFSFERMWSSKWTPA